MWTGVILCSCDINCQFPFCELSLEIIIHHPPINCYGGFICYAISCYGGFIFYAISCYGGFIFMLSAGFFLIVFLICTLITGGTQ